MAFYVTLVSDSSLPFFPGNKISHFVTQLPTSIDLNGEWEVGLSEIIYPHSWYNINASNNAFSYDFGDGKLNKRTIDDGCYEVMYDLLSAIQLSLPKNPSKFSFSYNKTTKRVKIDAVQGTSLYLENLGPILGFKQNTVIRGSMKSEIQADVQSGLSFFYVYSDLVSPQIVGDVYAPLLRIVRVTGQDGEMINQYYDRPQYLPVSKRSFHTINIELRLNSGEFVPFEKGKVIIVLHFRMKQIV